MDRKTASLLVAAGILAAVEVGLRWADAGGEGELPRGRPVVLVLGSSRSRAGLSPGEIEQGLTRGGVRDPWVANVSGERLTCVGLYQRYMEEIHPLASGNGAEGVVVAIEVRGSGLNDGYVSPEEEAFLERYRPEEGEGEASDLRSVGFLESLLGGRYAAACRALLGRSYVARGDRTLRPRLLGLFQGSPDRAGADPDPSPAGMRAPWARGNRGWVPYRDRKGSSLREEMWREHYRGTMLRGFHLGGVQTDFLRRLVRQVRRDGFEPLLYCMPVTEIQRGFYGPGEYVAYLFHVRELAASERVPFADLDSMLHPPLEAFVDTHHLGIGAVPAVCRKLVDEALLPLLRAPSRR